MTRSPLQRTEVRGSGNPIWCATCGNSGALSSLVSALSEAAVAEEELAVVAGPGCAGRLPRGLRGYQMELGPGLAVAAACGLARTRPDLTVLAVTGDGEASGAGLSALFAAGYRDLKMLYVILDNEIPAQAAGGNRWSVPGARRSLTELCIHAGASFVGSGLAAEIASSTAVLREALQHPGFSCVILRSACTTFHASADDLVLRSASRPVPADHNSGSDTAAGALAGEAGVHWIGTLLKRAPATRES